MPAEQTVLKIFIASPSDVAAERDVIEKIVDEFNTTWADRHHVRLSLLKFEKDIHPAIGDDGQDVINRQINDEYDIFIGIMWGRFGTATKRSCSGTEEEFLRAYSRIKTGDNIEIMFYFKDAAIPPSKIDFSQAARVQDFKKKISQEYGALYYQFESTEEFQERVRTHLSKVVMELLDKKKQLNTNEIVCAPEKTRLKEFFCSDREDPLANFHAFENSEFEDEEEIIGLVEQGGDALNEVSIILGRMTLATHTLGGKFRERTTELESANEKNDQKLRKRIINYTANDLELFVKDFLVGIPELHKQHIIFSNSFSKIAMIAKNESNKDIECVKDALSALREYRDSFDSNTAEVTDFQNTVANMGRMTTSFNTARKRAVVVLDDLIALFRMFSNQLNDIEALLERLLKY